MIASRFTRHFRQQFVGYLALFIALGGVSYAAVKLPANSVGSAQIKKGAVTKAKLSNDLVAAMAKAVPGPKGDTGANGDVGPAGAKGDTGAAGAKGDTGAAGAKGDTGAAGAKGDTGAAGAKGDTGAAGAKGDAGPKGDPGVKGDPGPKGDPCADPTCAGPQGPAGPAGPGAKMLRKDDAAPSASAIPIGTFGSYTLAMSCQEQAGGQVWGGLTLSGPDASRGEFNWTTSLGDGNIQPHTGGSPLGADPQIVGGITAVLTGGFGRNTGTAYLRTSDSLWVLQYHTFIDNRNAQNRTCSAWAAAMPTT